MSEFRKFDYLTDGEIDLIIEEKFPANDEKGFPPAYKYKITIHGSSEGIGKIIIRVGDSNSINYFGHIGYEIDESYRGNNYAAKACRIIKQVALAHSMDKLIITCRPDNIPSKRTIEKLGLKLLYIVDIPPQNDMYKLGDRQKCIYEWILNK